MHQEHARTHTWCHQEMDYYQTKNPEPHRVIMVRSPFALQVVETTMMYKSEKKSDSLETSFIEEKKMLIILLFSFKVLYDQLEEIENFWFLKSKSFLD